MKRLYDTDIRVQMERLNREARMFKDAWLITLLIFVGVIAVWLL